jgi:hypothetical protein
MALKSWLQEVQKGQLSKFFSKLITFNANLFGLAVSVTPIRK